MKKSQQNKSGKSCATLVMALPLAVAGLTFTPQGVHALPLASGLVQMLATTTAASTTANPIKSAAKINPTTVELTYANGKQLTVDFYGDNIFRLFRDDNGGVVRDPQATPPAKILVENARRNPLAVDLRDEKDGVVIATNRISLRFDKATGLLSVINTKNGEKVIESVQPVS